MAFANGDRYSGDFKSDKVRNVGSLLNGDEYKHAEPILHSRAHLVKKLEIMQATGQVA